MSEDRRKVTLGDFLYEITLVLGILTSMVVATSSYVHTQDDVKNIKSTLEKHIEVALPICADHERRITIQEESTKQFRVEVLARLDRIEKKLDGMR